MQIGSEGREEMEIRVWNQHWELVVLRVGRPSAQAVEDHS
jgi:hypothetical protein